MPSLLGPLGCEAAFLLWFDMLSQCLKYILKLIFIESLSWMPDSYLLLFFYLLHFLLIFFISAKHFVLDVLEKCYTNIDILIIVKKWSIVLCLSWRKPAGEGEMEVRRLCNKVAACSQRASTTHKAARGPFVAWLQIFGPGCPTPKSRGSHMTTARFCRLGSFTLTEYWLLSGEQKLCHLLHIQTFNLIYTSQTTHTKHMPACTDLLLCVLILFTQE